jgi:hypothetical protein
MMMKMMKKKMMKKITESRTSSDIYNILGKFLV